MKQTKSILTLSLALLGLAACSKWTDTGVKNPTNLTQNNKSEAYYEQLRAYKKSDHQIAFGWFGNWTGVGSSLQNSLVGLPDSVDVVSLWGTVGNLTEAQKADLRYFQNVKGGKAMLCWIVQDIGGPLTPALTDAKKAEYQAAYRQEQLDNGVAETNLKKLTDDAMALKWRYEYWGYVPTTDTSDEAQAKRLASARKYANAICDTLDRYGLDGFDIDYEPGFGHSGTMGGKDDMMTAFIEELSKRIGPTSKTGRLLAVDGEPHKIPAALGVHFNYFIVQAYQSSGYQDLDNRIGATISNYNGVLTGEEVARKYVVAENFESYASTGGVTFLDRQGNRLPSLLGMAMWNPIVNGKIVSKAGVGTYHMEYEYRASVEDYAGWFGATYTSPSDKKDFLSMKDVQGSTYPWLRKAIRIMNPQD